MAKPMSDAFETFHILREYDLTKGITTTELHKRHPYIKANHISAFLCRAEKEGYLQCIGKRGIAKIYTSTDKPFSDWGSLFNHMYAEHSKARPTGISRAKPILKTVPAVTQPERLVILCEQLLDIAAELEIMSRCTSK